MSRLTARPTTLVTEDSWMTSRRLARHSLKTRITLTTLLIFVIGIWSLTFYASRMLRGDMQKQLGDQQFSTASIIAGEVNEALQDRLNALENIAGTIPSTLMNNPKALQAMLEDRLFFSALFNGGVTVVALDGTAIADIPRVNGRIGVNYINIDYVATNLKEGKAMIGKPIIGPTLKAPVFGMGVPIRNADGKVIGAVSGVTNLGKSNFLDKFTQNHYGKTGGYLLVAPQHRLTVTASDKKRVMETLPAAGVSPILDRRSQGYEALKFSSIQWAWKC